jgi:hypothetical protein
MRNRTVLRVAIVIGTCSLAFVGPARSQQLSQRIVLTPYAGVFAPASTFSGIPLSEDVGSLRVRAKPAAAVGATVSYWINERTALELNGAYAFSDIQSKPLGASTWQGGLGSGLSAKAYTLLGSARVMYNIIPSQYNFRLRVGVGPAIVSRGGKAFDVSDGTIKGLTDVGGVASLCSRIPLMDRVALRLRAEDYIYSARIKFESPARTVLAAQRLQNDMMFSAGLQFAFNK